MVSADSPEDQSHSRGFMDNLTVEYRSEYYFFFKAFYDQQDRYIEYTWAQDPVFFVWN